VTTEHRPSDDLFWTAARYAWGELSAEQSAAFEERLADDEAACVALAEAVRLTVHLRAATIGPSTLPRSQSLSQAERTQRRWAAAWLTVATLAIATAWFAIRYAAPPSTVDPASTELLALWADSAGFPDGDLFDDFDSEPELLDESLAAPGWLVQAVQLSDDVRTSQPE
jgi:hypothetical protein